MGWGLFKIKIQTSTGPQKIVSRKFMVALFSFLMQLSIVSVLVVLRHGVNPKRLSAAICVTFAQINSIFLLRITKQEYHVIPGTWRISWI